MNVASCCRCVLTAGLAAAAFSVVTAAQVTGSINENAPRLSTRIDFPGDSMVELHYTAIAYGKGMWRMLPGQKSRHAEFNRIAASKPIGTFATTNHVVACGNLIPPGRYDLYFTIDRDQCWELNLRKQGGEGPIPIDWHMHAKSTAELHKRLHLAIDPVGEADKARFRFAFGTHVLTIPLELRDGENPYRKPADAKKNESNGRTGPPPGSMQKRGSKASDGRSAPRVMSLPRRGLPAVASGGRVVVFRTASG